MKSTERSDRIRQLFLAAGKIAKPEQERWLREHCAGDAELIAEVQSLLDYDNLPVDPLESGMVLPCDGFSNAPKPVPIRPTVPGYRIVRELGSGGQAIVFEAIQESTTQRVALKLLRWGQLASSHERERLRREVVILAQLSHPGIVSIIDCGETEDGVFFIATQSWTASVWMSCFTIRRRRRT